MFHNEKEFERLLQGLDIDASPRPGHRDELRRRILEEFDRTQAQKPAALSATALRKRKVIRLAPRIAGAAAAAVAIGLAAWLFFSPSQSFSDVLREIQKVHAVAYDLTVQFEDGSPDTMHTELTMDPLRVRCTLSAGRTAIYDYAQGKCLILGEKRKTASLLPCGRSTASDRNNPIERLRSFHETEAAFVGRGELDGRKVCVFRVSRPSETITVWVDPGTNLPVRIETINHLKTEQGDIKTFRAVTARFSWNPHLPDSLFSIELPPGYQWDKDVQPPPNEEDLLEAIRLPAEASDGVLPQMVDEDTLAGSVMKEQRKKGTVVTLKPEGTIVSESSDEAAKAAYRKAIQGVRFIEQQVQAGNDWHYVGGGVKLGDKDAIVCWWRPKGSATYRAVYGNLDIRDLKPGEIPASAATSTRPDK